MLTGTSFVYVPVLRLKAGEYRALAGLSADVADRIAPRLVLPPPGDRDPEARRVLTKDEILHETGRRIGRHWPLRLAFVEPRFLFPAFGDETSDEWLPEIFRVARSHHARPVPVATLADMIGARRTGFQRAVSDADVTKLAVGVASGEVDRDLKDRVRTAMSVFEVEPKDCVLLLDFSDADASHLTALAEVAASVLETAQGTGLWQEIVFQATNYPERNPADNDSSVLVDRNEWLAWKLTVESDDLASKPLIFGDYGADCAKFEFRSGGGIAIRHYRYCTQRHWIVQRGNADVLQVVAMRSVCQRILDSGMFAGRDFSGADNYIYETAQGLNGGGSAMTWREVNTGHHITQVVSDLGKMRSFAIKRHSFVDPRFQRDLFPA